MVKPSDLWAPFKSEWYDDETGELREPHRSRLLASGTSIERIVEMETEVAAEIAEFHRKNSELPIINGKNWAERELEKRQRRQEIPASMRSALYRGTYDPDANYD